MAIRPRRIDSPTTAAVVQLTNPRFEDADGAGDQDSITMDMLVTFNGVADNFTGTITFARNATTAVKNAAVRTQVNAFLAGLEAGGSLNNANIQIVGLPV